MKFKLNRKFFMWFFGISLVVIWFVNLLMHNRVETTVYGASILMLAFLLNYFTKDE